MTEMFKPDFEAECRVCGATPCVIVVGHMQPETGLCGVCFWHNRSMIDWTLWNDRTEDTE